MVLRKLGPYTIHEPLGSGGMGTVYRGVEDGSNREVAIKVLSPALVTDPNFRERFASEIKSLEQLAHPNIVELFGFGEHDGQLFYAMELVAGSNLQEELAAGRRFDWREVIAIGQQICSALKHAHDHGIIHRDIKPANLIIDSRDDTIQLTDFGIAKLFGNTSQTIDGGVLGTADYMSPEQAEGISVTPRSDIYSLGAVLYALLAGRPPFQGKSLPEVVHKVRFEPSLPVRRFAPDTPEELEELLETLLAKNPRERVRTAVALSKRLIHIRQSMSIDSSSADSRRSDSALPDSPALGTSPARPKSSKSLNDPDSPASLPRSSNAIHNAAAPSAGSLSAEEQLAALETAIVSPEAFDVHRTQNASVLIVENESIDGAPSSNRYTSVDEDYRKRLLDVEHSPESLMETVGKWLGVICSLAAVAWALWFFLGRPPSADRLFATIEKSMQGGQDDAIMTLDEIAIFLDSFPNDQRREKVIAWQSDAEIARQTRRLETLSRTMIKPNNIEATEWLLIEAIRNERTDPAKAVTQYDAIIHMFDVNEQLSDTDQRCLVIAKQRGELLTAPTNSVGTQQQIDFIANRIEMARTLMKTDPATAQTILQSVVDFYEDTPWATELLNQARGLLDK